MSAAQQYIARAQTLPPPLLHFFKRWRPPQLNSTPAISQTISIAENTSSADPNVGASTITEDVEVTPLSTNKDAGWKVNPFLPFKNPQTGNWHGPHYSLRRQADLFKLARTHGVLSLMPPSPKHPDIKQEKRVEHGLRVKGTGVGQKVKGKLWERTLRSRLDLRTRAMEKMPDLVALWRLRGHGRGWKKYPKGKANSDFVFDPSMSHLWAHQPKVKRK